MMSPPTEFSQFESKYSWVELFLSYQYSAILQINLAEGSFRNLVLSVDFTPSMLITGLAVYLENVRRGDETGNYTAYSKMRMEVASNTLAELQQVVIKNRQWPLTSNALYGAFFIDYLAKTYGEEKILQFLEHYSTSLVSYLFLNAETTEVFGKDFLSLWADFQVYLKKEFTPEITALLKTQVNGQSISSSPFLQKSSSGKGGFFLHAVTGQDRHEIKQFNGDRWEHVTYVKQLRDLDSHPEYGLIVTRNIDYANLKSMHDIFLYSNKKWIRITTQKRFKYVRWAQDGKEIFATRHIQGSSELWKLNLLNDTSTLIFSFPNDYIIGEFDVSPDGSHIIASVKTPNLNWSLLRFDINTKLWTSVTQKTQTESAPEFMADGSLLYSANYDGTFNIYHLNADQNRFDKVTNTIAGAFKPKWQGGAGLIYQTYDATEYSVRKLTSLSTINTEKIQHVKHKRTYSNASLQSSQIDNNVNLTDDIFITQPEPYSTLRTLKPHSWIPWGYTDVVRSLVGVNTYGGDALGRHNYEVYALWDVQNKLPTILAQYKFDNRWELNFINDYKYKNIMLDHSSPRYQITKDRKYSLQRNNILNYWEDQLRLHAGISYSTDKLERLPEIPPNTPPQTIDLLLQERDELTVGLAFTFNNQQHYLDVDGVGSGHYIDFIFEKNIWETDFAGQKYQGQWKGVWDLPGRATLLTRLAGGYSTTSAKRFSVGGNNLLEESQLFNRSAQTIRGYDDLSQLGHNYLAQRAELYMWIGNISHNFGLLPAGVGDVSGKLYVDSGSAWDKDRTFKQLTGVGGELQLDTILGYNYILPISIGYAYGLDDIKGIGYFYMNFSSMY